MTPENYAKSAGQLRFLLERLRAIQARFDTLPAHKDSAAFSRRHMLGRMLYRANHMCQALTINFGHSEEGLAVLTATTVAGTILDDDQTQFIRDQAADELAYKNGFGKDVTNDEIIQASSLEIEEMLPVLQTIVDRCASLLTAEL